jgi:diguanylate cyclase (GGDEF)-like protein
MSQNANGATVLVVDDDAIVRLMAREALTEAGCIVVEAASAEEGLERFAQSAADLVLLDVMLPGMNGHQACARLRAYPGGESVPIIVMTGLDDRKSIHEAYNHGATDFITKPIVWDLLPYRVRYALRASRALLDSVRSQALLVSSQRIARMGSWEWISASDWLTCSDELYQIQGTERAEMGHGFSGLLEGVHPQDRDVVKKALVDARGDAQPYRIEFRIVKPDGTVCRLSEQTDIERDSVGRVVAIRGIRQDITQQVEANNRIRKLAYFDSLTGLANRALFGDMVQHWLPYAARRGLRCAVLFVGLDRFKLINESLGPRLGDELIKAVSARLRECVRAGDIKGVHRVDGDEELLARLGGDEFTILLVDVGDADQVLRVALRITDTLTAPFALEGKEVTLGASIGIAVTPQDGQDVDSLLRNAGTAMRAAKEDGRSYQIRFYDAAMSAGVVRKLGTEIELRRALDSGGELRLFYQAKVDARTSQIVGAEALLRWQHPQRGLVGPGDFIAVAEESGLIVPITDWIIAEVCRQQAQWRCTGLAIVPVSINLAAASLKNDCLVATIGTAVAQHGVATCDIEVEVTESSLMRDMEHANRVLRQLKALGLKLSIDDFGTGYSSLTYLKRFPVDVLKIDRSFIRDLTTDANDAALTSAIIAMGKSLNLELVAEGVETWEQADFLLQRDCHLVQGFLFAKPVPSEAFARLLRTGLSNRATALEQVAVP